MSIYLSNRNIAHFDLDTFFVSVERLQNSKLNGIPVAVGGNSDRAVIATCSYEARTFGVHSGMAVKIAKRLCPQLTLIQGDMENYSKYSKVVTDIVQASVPLYEKSSIDEFYIDMSGMDKYFGCAQYIAELKKTIIKESGLPISYGLSVNKLVSKVATGQGKPNGAMVVAHGNEKKFLAPLPIQKIPMIGNKTAELLNRMGVETVETLSQIPEQYLINLLGKNGLEIHKRANGIDETPVTPYQEQKSISTEETFDKDTIDVQYIYSELARMCERIAFELRAQNKLVGCLTVKLRYSNFDTVTKQMTIAYTANTSTLQAKVRALFDKLYDRRLLVRLVGIRLSNLVQGSYQISLFDDTQEQIELYQSIDYLKKRFGASVLMSARSIITQKQGRHNNPQHYDVTSFGAKAITQQRQIK
jgi:DNA polymerase IV